MSADTELMKFQIEQLRHDELAHKDILCLPVQTRIKHMVLHFAKYVGKLVEARQLESHDLLASTLVDTWVIVLASANMLNIRLSEKLNPEDIPYQNLQSIGQAFAGSQFISSKDPFDLALFELGKSTGRMAKACESLDHMEKFPFREAVEQGVLEIARLTLAISATLGINLYHLVSLRWKEVERKSIFFKTSEEHVSAKDLLAAYPTRIM